MAVAKFYGLRHHCMPVVPVCVLSLAAVYSAAGTALRLIRHWFSHCKVSISWSVGRGLAQWSLSPMAGSVVCILSSVAHEVVKQFRCSSFYALLYKGWTNFCVTLTLPSIASQKRYVRIVRPDIDRPRKCFRTLPLRL